MERERLRRRKRRAPRLSFFIDVLLVGMVFVNLFICFWARSDKKSPPQERKSTWVSTPREDTRNWSIVEEFTDDELSEAIEGLQLPTWSRSYTHCNSTDSEVTCAQVVHAWRVLSRWVENQKQPFENHKHLFVQHFYAGVGNRLATHASAFVLALMDNRTFSVAAVYPTQTGNGIGVATDLHPSVHVVGREPGSARDVYHNQSAAKAFQVWTFSPWLEYRWDILFNMHDDLLIDYLLYSTMPYLNPDMADFSYTHFGRHAAYFVSNFLDRIPESALEAARQAVEGVPQNVRLFGVHVRIHIPGEYFSYSVQRTMDAIVPFLMYVANQQPTVFALATDNAEVEAYFRKLFGNKMVTTSAMRRPDADHESALYDLALLEMCDECLLTYRSTFSLMVMARMGKRAWFVDKESTDVFQLTSSQVAAISTLYHQFDPNDWQPNRRMHLFMGNEQTLRKYYKYFML